MREAIEEAFWSFVDQKWRDALNVAAAEPPSWGTGSGKGAPHGGDRRGMAEAKKLAQAKEREKIIEDNQLCPFCLLHDKAKPCGAKETSQPGVSHPGLQGQAHSEVA
jgi:hypothetical protein